MEKRDKCIGSFPYGDHIECGCELDQSKRTLIQELTREKMILESKLAAERERVCRWEPIATAPKDGSEILGYRKDCGVMLIRYVSLEDFLTTGQLEKFDEETATCLDWFAADFDSGCRLEGDETPTHWCHLPKFSGRVEVE